VVLAALPINLLFRRTQRHSIHFLTHTSHSLSRPSLRPLAQFFPSTRSPSPSSAITSSLSLLTAGAPKRSVSPTSLLRPPYVLALPNPRVHSSVVTPTCLATQVGAPKHGSTEQVGQGGSSRQALSSSAGTSRQRSLSAVRLPNDHPRCVTVDLECVILTLR